jgi:hypothetical protein
VFVLAVVSAVAGGGLMLSAAEAVGSLLVESEPAGASVWVDGRLAGQTPLNVERLAAGVHRVRLVRLGFLEHSRLVTVKAGSRATLRSRLTAPRSQNASGQAALRIVVLDGEGAVNIIRQKTATAPVVEVRDQNDLPVAGVPVTFSISGAGASFGGSSALTVVTNGAGRAAAAGLTPTGSGALQIGISATFQGQTAVAAVAQLNVLTAAQAASASAAAASSGGAAGGGMSGTTLSIVGTAAAAGVVVAAKTLSGKEPAVSAGTYAAPYSGQMSMTFSTFASAGTQVCIHTRTVDGTLTLTLEEPTAGQTRGTAVTTTVQTVVAVSAGCSPANPAVGSRIVDAWNLPVVISGQGITFAGDRPYTSVPFSGGSVSGTRTLTFAGTSANGAVTGTMTLNDVAQGTTQGFPLTWNGSATMPVALR